MDLQQKLNSAFALKKQGKLLDALKLYNECFDTLAHDADQYAHSFPDTNIVSQENGEKIHTTLPKHFEKAKEYLMRDKIVAVISNNMGVIFAELGDYQGAQEMFEQSIELTPIGIEYKDPSVGLKELLSLKKS